MEIYEGLFGSWADVQRQFEMNVPEPEQVIYAEYDQPGYDGWANVFYRIGDQFYWAYGSHCSCYGLEGQWDPEEYDAQSLVHALRKGNHWRLSENARQIEEFVIAAVEEYAYKNVGGHA